MTAVEKLSRLNFPKTLTYYLHPVWSSAAQNYNASYHLTSLYNSSKCMRNLMQTRANLCWRNCLNGSHYIYAQFFLYSLYSSRPPSRSFRRRASKRLKAKSTPMLDEVQFRQVLSQLPPRFSSEELCNVITLQEDPLICLELFKWASQQPRFRHDASTYHITIKKLGVAKMYQEMDDVVNQVLAVPYIGTEPLYNSIIYFFTEARKLTRAVNIFKHMKKCLKLDCRPSIRTYNLLFAAFLSRGRNSYVNHVYMETIRGLFKQLVSDGIEPDIFTLNCMIKGYVLSLHVNDALRVFHQMDVVYKCQPNSFSYNYLIHGLCAQGRTINASELCNEMKEKGHTPSSKSYNSLVNALALGGEVEDAVSYLWEMIEKQISVDFITYRTIFDEICRQGRVEEAMMLLKDLQEKDVLDVDTYRKLRGVFEDDFANTDHRNVFRCFSSSGPQILRVGDILRQSRIFSGEDIIDYSKVSHDSNPLHFDAEVARNSGFEDRLVHGMLVAALFPRIIASRFVVIVALMLTFLLDSPQAMLQPGAIYVSQSLQFKWPVYVGDEVKGEIEAVNIRESKNKYMVKFLTKCFKRGELLVIDGEAVAILPSLALG